MANERRRFGYRRLFVLLRREGEPSGINRIYRLYREEGLSVRKRKARRRAVGTRAPILVEAKANARWSLDFVYDQFACGRRFRVLNIVDDVTRECLAAVPDTSISGRRAARERIASQEMFPDCWPLPHLICSQHLWVLSKSDEANQRDDEEGIGCCSGKAVCCRKAGVKLAHPRSVRSDQRVASQTCDALAA